MTPAEAKTAERNRVCVCGQKAHQHVMFFGDRRQSRDGKCEAFRDASMTVHITNSGERGAFRAMIEVLERD